MPNPDDILKQNLKKYIEEISKECPKLSLYDLEYSIKEKIKDIIKEKKEQDLKLKRYRWYNFFKDKFIKENFEDEFCKIEDTKRIILNLRRFDCIVINHTAVMEKNNNGDYINFDDIMRIFK